VANVASKAFVLETWLTNDRDVSADLVGEETDAVLVCFSCIEGLKITMLLEKKMLSFATSAMS
jgi:hypothetical protein